jgi:CBS domain-containing protein
MTQHGPASDPFHDVGSIFPSDVEVESVRPATTVVEALHIMATKRFSQLPVIEDGRLRGVFSLWSLASHLIGSPMLAPQDLAVEDIMEKLPEVTVDDSLDLVLELLDRHEALLVRSPHGVQAIVTPMDVLNYFYKIARPFVLLQEIELALRSVIDTCVTKPQLEQCIKQALGAKYAATSNRAPPSRLSEMSFEDYKAIVTSKANWPLFEGVLGRNRELTGSKLEQVRLIRNKVFHFREPISVLDYDGLAIARNWLLDKLTRIRGSQREVVG